MVARVVLCVCFFPVYELIGWSHTFVPRFRTRSGCRQIAAVWCFNVALLGVYPPPATPMFFCDVCLLRARLASERTYPRRWLSGLPLIGLVQHVFGY